MMNTHPGLHAPVRSNRLDVHRATWKSLKTLLNEKSMQKKCSLEYDKTCISQQHLHPQTHTYRAPRFTTK